MGPVVVVVVVAGVVVDYVSIVVGLVQGAGREFEVR